MLVSRSLDVKAAQPEKGRRTLFEVNVRIPDGRVAVAVYVKM